MTRDELEAVIRRQMTRTARSMLQAADSNRIMNDAVDTILAAADEHAASHATALFDLEHGIRARQFVANLAEALHRHSRVYHEP